MSYRQGTGTQYFWKGSNLVHVLWTLLKRRLPCWILMMIQVVEVLKRHRCHHYTALIFRWFNIQILFTATEVKTEPWSPYLAFDRQVSEREPELVYLPPPQIAPEGEVLSSVVPVFGESFCQCDQQHEVTPGLGPCSECFCGEDDQGENTTTVTHICMCVETG